MISLEEMLKFWNMSEMIKPNGIKYYTDSEFLGDFHETAIFSKEMFAKLLENHGGLKLIECDLKELRDNAIYLCYNQKGKKEWIIFFSTYFRNVGKSVKNNIIFIPEDFGPGYIDLGNGYYFVVMCYVWNPLEKICLQKTKEEDIYDFLKDSGKEQSGLDEFY